MDRSAPADPADSLINIRSLDNPLLKTIDLPTSVIDTWPKLQARLCELFARDEKPKPEFGVRVRDGHDDIPKRVWVGCVRSTYVSEVDVYVKGRFHILPPPPPPAPLQRPAVNGVGSLRSVRGVSASAAGSSDSGATSATMNSNGGSLAASSSFPHTLPTGTASTQSAAGSSPSNSLNSLGGTTSSSYISPTAQRHAAHGANHRAVASAAPRSLLISSPVTGTTGSTVASAANETAAASTVPHSNPSSSSSSSPPSSSTAAGSSSRPIVLDDDDIYVTIWDRVTRNEICRAVTNDTTGEELYTMVAEGNSFGERQRRHMYLEHSRKLFARTDTIANFHVREYPFFVVIY